MYQCHDASLSQISRTAGSFEGPISLLLLSILLVNTWQEVPTSFLSARCSYDIYSRVFMQRWIIYEKIMKLVRLCRPGAHQSATTLAGEQAAALPIYEEEVDKGLLTLLKSDRPGLQIRDLQGRWMVVDADLGPQDMVLFTGLSLYQTTGGHLSPSFHRTDINTHLGQQAAQGSMPYGRCTVAFKLMPRASAILHCAAMSAAGHPLGGPFQHPVPVHEFMQRSHPTDQLVVGRPGVPTFSFSAPVEGEAIYLLRIIPKLTSAAFLVFQLVSPTSSIFTIFEGAAFFAAKNILKIYISL